MHEVWLSVLALSDSRRGVKDIQGKAVHHLTEESESPVVCFICLSGLLRRLRLAMIDRHVSLPHAKK